ncbi:hypothetical protein SAMN04487969_111103 [Paenibacillus algorifonticola]|uniref:Uncharacterized protein n=1 Tax=Paenibacillus algorifonticola TaxID=684063 RepID=A0A1I2F769_9BACL|nr:hypothetical protein SAMN04487969_111103 [Paenibacillus algorifonticola]
MYRTNKKVRLEFKETTPIPLNVTEHQAQDILNLTGLVTEESGNQHSVWQLSLQFIKPQCPFG